MGRISRTDLVKNEEIIHRVNKINRKKEGRKEGKVVDWSQVAWELSSETTY
jgi:hypothetical protein